MFSDVELCAISFSLCLRLIRTAIMEKFNINTKIAVPMLNVRLRQYLKKASVCFVWSMLQPYLFSSVLFSKANKSCAAKAVSVIAQVMRKVCLMLDEISFLEFRGKQMLRNLSKVIAIREDLLSSEKKAKNDMLSLHPKLIVAALIQD